MSRPHGRARVNSTSPEAFAVCSRCGVWRNHVDLIWQYQYAGTGLYNTQILVCVRCVDLPFEQLKTVILPPDPLPVINARIENFAYDEAGPTQTQVAQFAATLATMIYVDDVTGFSVADNVLIGMDNGSFAEEEITAIDPILNTIGISIPLPYHASINSLVSAALT